MKTFLEKTTPILPDPDTTYPAPDPDALDLIPVISIFVGEQEEWKHVKNIDVLTWDETTNVCRNVLNSTSELEGVTFNSCSKNNYSYCKRFPLRAQYIEILEEEEYEYEEEVTDPETGEIIYDEETGEPVTHTVTGTRTVPKTVLEEYTHTYYNCDYYGLSYSEDLNTTGRTGHDTLNTLIIALSMAFCEAGVDIGSRFKLEPLAFNTYVEAGEYKFYLFMPMGYDESQSLKGIIEVNNPNYIPYHNEGLRIRLKVPVTHRANNNQN